MNNELVVFRDEPEESGYVTAEVYLNPLPGTEPIRVKARIGSLVRDILPKEARAPMVCLIDGVPMKREWWMRRPVCQGDRIQFAPVFLGGRNGSGQILAAIAMIVVTIYAPYLAEGMAGAIWGSAAAAPAWGVGLIRAGIILIGSSLISALIPGARGGNLGEGDKPSSVYSVDTQGNQARIFSPIPVQYGRLRYYPNYAAQPYVEYLTAKPSWVNSRGTANYGDGQQFYYALFCLGQGKYDVHYIQLADANLGPQEKGVHCVYDDVLVCRILQPGERPTYVNPTVVTSEAVSGQSLDSGEWIGPFPGCGPGRRIKSAMFDLIFPQGLCTLNDSGKAKWTSVHVTIQGRLINEAAEPLGDWQVLIDTNVGYSSVTPQRRTLRCDLNPNGRWEFRLQRHGKKDPEDSKNLTSCQWSALRGCLVDTAPLCQTATHLELVMRASEQLSSLSQRKVSVIATRMLSSWDDPTLRPTRSPARALWDKWTNNVYGDGMPLHRIDVDMLRRYDALAAQRGDKFDYVFENRTSSKEADQLIAGVMRCVALQRQGVKTLVRDELVDMPLTLFNPTNIDEKSVSIDYIQVTEETTDGVIVEFFNENTWDWQEVECPGPGRTYSSTTHPRYNPNLPVMENPARMTLNGIVTWAHAEREGLYYAYTNALRRQFISWTTELQGATIYYGAPVLLSTTLYNAMRGGEVRDFNENNGTFSLTTPVSDGKIVFMKKDGTVSAPLSFTVVEEQGNWIKVNDRIDFAINYGSHTKERTKYIIVTGELIRRIVKVTSLTPKGLSQNGVPSYEIKGVVDVPEVHTIDGTVTVPPTPVPVPVSHVSLYNAEVYTKQAVYPNSGCPATMVFYPNGTLRSKYYDGTAVAMRGDGEMWGAWLSDAPKANAGSDYEIMFMACWTCITSEGAVMSPPPYDIAESALPAWLNDTSRPFMQGHKIKIYGFGEDAVDESTLGALQYASNFMVGSGGGQSFIAYTDWLPMTNTVELSSYYDLAPSQIPSVEAKTEWRNFFAVIRSKRSGVFQDGANYRLGFWRQP